MPTAQLIIERGRTKLQHRGRRGLLQAGLYIQGGPTM